MVQIRDFYKTTDLLHPFDVCYTALVNLIITSIFYRPGQRRRWAHPVFLSNGGLCTRPGLRLLFIYDFSSQLVIKFGLETVLRKCVFYVYGTWRINYWICFGNDTKFWKRQAEDRVRWMMEVYGAGIGWWWLKRLKVHEDSNVWRLLHHNKAWTYWM